MPNLIARKIASGLARPVFATAPPGDTVRLFIVEQKTGKIRILRLATGLISPAPSLQVSGLGIAGNEQGLLGLAFAPDYVASGFLYVNMTNSSNGTTIRRYQASAANADVADPASAKDLMTFAQPFANHQGGWIGFGPNDKLLYISVGDGGSENDPRKTAQNPKLPQGKIFRIDVAKDDFPVDPAKNYAIPPGNPFVGNTVFLPEIWALGVRNPWRCSFDRETGDFYFGDVGQNQFEEINFQPAASKGGENYGWSLREGKHDFHPAAGPPPALTDPIFEYTHDNGEQGVIGGYVYRGAAIAGLQGTYFYADIIGLVSSLEFDGKGVRNQADRIDELFPGGGPSAISAFGEDSAGEIYIINLLPGELHKITPKP